MAGTAVKIKESYNGLDPATIFQVDPATKTLTPFSSGQAYTDAGYQFGQEKLANPADYAGFNVGNPIAPRAAQLDAVKTDLNKFQDSLFGADATDPNKRRASAVDEQITQSLADAEAERKQFEELRTKYNSLDNVSLFDEYNKLRDAQGVGQTEKDLTTTRDAERNLPDELRTVSGNAAPIPESVYQANLAEKQKPLLLKEQTLSDRLTLAN